MAFLKAKECLKKFGLEEKIMEFEVSSATVKDAALAIGCTEDEIAKTIALTTGERTILIVASGNSKIDNKKYKDEFNVKAKMLQFEEVEPLVGHAVGGVCPFGVNDGVDVYLDISIKKYNIVYPACGSSNSAVKLTIDELEKSSGYIKWVDVCKV